MKKLYIKIPWSYYKIIANGDMKEWNVAADKYWQNKLFESSVKVRSYEYVVISSFNCGPQQIEVEFLGVGSNQENFVYKIQFGEIINQEA